MDSLDKLIVNHLQAGFPVCSAPYKNVAEQLGIAENVLMERIQCLLAEGILSRFGPMYHAEKIGGGLTLGALAVPETRFDQVAAIVNGFPEVAHNYARNHRLNMWFVLATEKPEQVAQVIAQIQANTGLKVYDMPKIHEFYVGLQLEA